MVTPVQKCAVMYGVCVSRKKNKIKNHALDSQKIMILYTINKEDSSPSLRCVRCPKVEIFVKMFRTKLQSRHDGGPL